MQSLPESRKWHFDHLCLDHCFNGSLSYHFGCPLQGFIQGNPLPELVRQIEVAEMSSASPSREGSASEKKAVLSEGQRKENHNSSETKRRNRLRAWHLDLCQLVPELKDNVEDNCKSERLVLEKTTAFAREIMQQRNDMIDALAAKGVDAEREFGLTKFKIPPLVDPMANREGEDGVGKKESNGGSAKRKSKDGTADKESEEPPRKRRRANHHQMSVISDGP
ncbi:MAG: hypothetical protein Q9223_000178 [Gallowayella weberi]